jgi:hypothetical protein
MAGQYVGHYRHNKISVDLNAPLVMGVYYLGALNLTGGLVPYYIGRAMGTGVTIKSRLIDHLSEWQDVTHFGYVTFNTPIEAQIFEDLEIKKHNPKYNKIGKS